MPVRTPGVAWPLAPQDGRPTKHIVPCLDTVVPREGTGHFFLAEQELRARTGAPAVNALPHIPQAAIVPRRYRLLRLSVTDLCNFRCRYCMPAQGVARLSHDNLLTLEALSAMVRWLAAEVGIERVRITGGEPLVRHGIENLLRLLSSLPGIREIALTTNGTLLGEYAAHLKQAGLTRVNVSLDSLDAARFAQVTRGGELRQTLEGIAAARDAGLLPIKLNAVLRRSTWRQDVPALLDYAQVNDYEIRFIELMRTGTQRAWCESELITVDEVCRELHAAPLADADGGHAPARATVVNWRGESMRVGWIAPRSHPFCATCDRLRMDARGRLRRCLMDATTLDLPGLLALGTVAARQGLHNYLQRKAPPRAMDSEFAMSQMGG